MSNRFTNPSHEAICQRLRQVRTIAVVGLSPKTNRPSYGVAQALQQFGYRIIPVRPAVDEVLGERAYPDLESVPVPIDLVDVFRAPEHVGPIVESCIRLDIPAVWLQDGVINGEAALRAQAAGLWVVMDRCIYRDHLACGHTR